MDEVLEADLTTLLSAKVEDLGNEKVIDIVIPLYKAKKTIARLLSSISVQTMSKNITVILVQDDDKDNYKEEIEIFNKILDIRLIKLEKNSGPGTARRVGMKSGNSKYIVCIDADDTFFDAFSLEKLYVYIEKTELDAVNSSFQEQINSREFYLHNNDWVWMFGKIYRRKFLEENNIEMNDSRANEDTGFNKIVYNTGEIGTLEDITYIWHFNENSITRREKGIYRFTGIKGWIKNMAWANGELKRLKIDKNKYKKLVLESMVVSYFFYLGFCNDEDKRVNPDLVIKWLKKYYLKYYKEQNYTKEDILECYRRIAPTKEEIVKFIPEINIYQFIERVEN